MELISILLLINVVTLVTLAVVYQMYKELQERHKNATESADKLYLLLKQLSTPEAYVSLGMYHQFSYYLKMYLQLHTFSTELFHAFKYYYKGKEPGTSDANFESYIVNLYKTNILSRNWAPTNFPPFTQGHLDFLVLKYREEVDKKYGKDNR
jgi:hypothetical protein